MTPSAKSPSEIRTAIKSYIIDELTFGELDEAELADDTQLLEGGLINSMSILKIVAFMEEQFGFTIQPADVRFENFLTVEDIGKLVETKLSQTSA